MRINNFIMLLLLLVSSTSYGDAAGNASGLMTLAQILDQAKKKLAEAAKSGDKDAAPTDITTSGQSTSETLTTKIQSAIDGSSTTLKMTAAGSEVFTLTINTLNQIKMDVQTYTSAAKTSCYTKADTTEFLCVEKSSPGAKSAKVIMDLMGPAVAAMGSAQKACNSTVQITEAVGAILATAKGVCVASKLLCDSKCGTAVGDLEKIITKLDTIDSSIQTDEGNSIFQCKMVASSEAASECAATTVAYMACYSPAYDARYLPCETETKSKVAAANSTKQSILAALQAENNKATAGTSPWLVAKCESKIEDIGLLAINIASVLASKAKADECDKKVSNGPTSGDPSIANIEYCNRPGNADTQFCKCKTNNNQEGCSGYIAPTDNVTPPSDIAGAIVPMGSGGPSGFAGPGGNKNPPTIPGNGPADDGTTSDPSGNSDLNKSTAAGGNKSPFGGSSGIAGKSGGPKDGSSGDKTDNSKDKKWSFGAFGNSLAGMFGGGKGSKNSANGTMSSKQAAAIERKLASDKLAKEISSASGMSNWEKIRQAYLIKENTLMSGQ